MKRGFLKRALSSTRLNFVPGWTEIRKKPRTRREKVAVLRLSSASSSSPSSSSSSSSEREREDSWRQSHRRHRESIHTVLHHQLQRRWQGSSCFPLFFHPLLLLTYSFSGPSLGLAIGFDTQYDGQIVCCHRKATSRGDNSNQMGAMK